MMNASMLLRFYLGSHIGRAFIYIINKVRSSGVLVDDSFELGGGSTEVVTSMAELF